MKKLFSLTKTLLVAAGLVVGASAWGQTMTTMTGLLGPTDNSNGFAAYKSMALTLAAGDSYTYTLVNYNKGASGTNIWENWAVEATNGTKFLDFRADGGYWGELPSAASYTGSTSTTISSTATDWLAAYNGVTVTITVSRSSDGTTFTVAHSATTNTDVAYTGTYTATISASDAITFYLTNELSHQIITNVVYTDASGISTTYATLEHTAGAKWGSGYDGTYESTVDAAAEFYNNMSGNWQGSAYAKFSYTIPEGVTITKALLTYNTNQGGSKGRTDKIYVMKSGFDLDWTNFAGQKNTDLSNSSDRGSYTTCETGGSGVRQNLSADVTSLVNTIYAAGQNYILFQWTDNAAAANLYGKGATDYAAPTLSITYSTETLYTVTFTETNSLTPTITVYSDEGRTASVEPDQLSANTTYYYTATLAGYNDYNGSFAVGTSNPSVEFTMTEKTRYTFKVNLIDESSNIIITKYTDTDSYEGKVHNIAFNKYLTDANKKVTYTKDADTYSASYTALAKDETYTMSYTTYSGTAYFVEAEAVISGTSYTSGYCSNNGAVRGFTTAKSLLTVPVDGKYNVTYAFCNNNVNYSLTCTLSSINNGDIATTGNMKSISVNSLRSDGIITVNDVPLLTSDVLKLCPSSTNGIVDYMLIERTGDATVSATIGATGYSTFASAYPLDLASLPEGLTAYYASKVGGGKVTLTEATAAVPAGTGLVLKGTKSTAYSIPVAASAETLSGNLLVGCTTSTDLTANAKNYVLVNNGGTAEFQSLADKGATIPAGKAYLNAPAGARLSIVFEDESTGISTIENANVLGNGAIYNLNGQRVEKAQKGLYIIDGKKVMMK